MFKAKGIDFVDMTIKNQEHGAFFAPELSNVNFLYLSQPYPFNNFFMWNKVPNATPSKLKVEYWNGKAWIAMADVIDATSVNEVTQAKSGVVYFSPDPAEPWTTIDDSTKVTEINKAKIYCSYWLRISSDVAIDIATELKEVSYCFSSSYDIDGLDSEVAQYMGNIETGKTSWTKELVNASKLVVMDMKKFNIIRNPGELLSIEEVSPATTQRALMIIYNHLGRSFVDKMAAAQKAYTNALSFRTFTIDKNKNGRVDHNEQGQKQNKLVR